MKKMQIRMQLVCLFSMLLLFFPVELFAQQGTITGKVVDERGESVIGATVMVKGSLAGPQARHDIGWHRTILPTGSDLVG